MLLWVCSETTLGSEQTCDIISYQWKWQSSHKPQGRTIHLWSPIDVAIAPGLGGFKRGFRQIHTEVYQWILVMMAKCNIHVQKFHTSDHQLLENNSGNGKLPSCPSCVASQKHKVGQCVKQKTGIDLQTDQERLVFISTHKMQNTAMLKGQVDRRWICTNDCRWHKNAFY